MKGLNISNSLIWLTVCTGFMVILGTDFVRDFGSAQRARIEIAELTFDLADTRPMILQDRSVTGRRPVWAVWKARVRSEKGAVVCAGEGYWPYATGRRVAPIPFDSWVGDPGCWQALRPGIYQACALYFVADNEPEEECTLGFRKRAAEPDKP